MLAIAQANEVVRSLKEVSPAVRFQVVTIKTSGDKLSESEANLPEGKGVFTKEIEESLLKGEIHIAVHSMKDLTTDIPDGLAIAAVPPRANHRDALISRKKEKFDQLPGGARIGTSSPRRKTQLMAARPDLQIWEMRGNVDTRLRKLEDGSFDAIVLAAAGLTRLGLEKHVTEFLSTKVMLPAIGQGALAIETRQNDSETLALVSQLDDKSTRAAIETERAFARRLSANCRTPIAAYARKQERKLTIEGMVSSVDGRMLLREQLTSNDSNHEKVGEELAESLLRKGANLVLEAV